MRISSFCSRWWLAAAAIVLGGPMLQGRLAAQSWYNSGWSNRKPITIDHTKVAGSSSLTGFPLLISVTSDANLKTVSNGGSVGKADGTDILFTAGDGVTKLNHEMESYNPSTGQLTAWVNVPALSPIADASLYLYYGNASSVDQQNRPGVWDSNFKGVWHLKETNMNSGTTLSDSTSNALTMTNGAAYCCGSGINTIAASAAAIGGGGYFQASGQYSGATAVSSSVSGLGSGANLTMEAWTKFQSAVTYDLGYNSYVDTGTGYPYNTVGLVTNNSGVAFVVFDSSGTPHITGYAPTSLTTWYHVVGTYDGSTLKVYVNGALSASTAASFTRAGDAPLWFGYGSYYRSRSTDVVLDEVRISNATRSTDWIATEYNNQHSPSTFYSVGGQQSSGGSGVAVTVTTAPSGLLLTVDGGSCTAPCGVQWTAGSAHTIATTATQAGATGTQYLFASWSDGGALSHSVTAPSSSATYTASFTTQYALTTAASPGAGGTISPASAWYNSGAVVAVSAAANGGYQFNGFSGGLSGTTTPQNLTMNAPAAVTASFGTGSGGADLNTYYTYDLLNHVTQVSMPRSTGTQTRTFNYTSGGVTTAYLQSATNPENGTVNYTYNTDGTPATKTDAKGQRVVYSWDGFKRLSQVQHYPAPGTVEDVCQRITYYYDSDAFSGSFSQYAWGRRTGTEYNPSGCNTSLPAQFRERYSYTPGGLVTKKRLTVTALAGSSVQSVKARC